MDLAAVDQAEVDHVDGDLGVVDAPQPIQHRLDVRGVPADGPAPRRLHLPATGSFFPATMLIATECLDAQSIGIGPCDSRQHPVADLDGEAAAETLDDHDLLPRGED